jgi:hypothetical protein
MGDSYCLHLILDGVRESDEDSRAALIQEKSNEQKISGDSLPIFRHGRWRLRRSTERERWATVPDREIDERSTTSYAASQAE